MNIFKYLYGGYNKIQGETKPDINILFSSPDTNNALIEIDNYGCKLCLLGDTLDRLTEPRKNFYFNQTLEREINNGGFNQYFFNSNGNFTYETITFLETIGANKTANILQKIIEPFPDSTVPKDRAKQQVILEQMEDTANEVWEQLDQTFYKYEDDLNKLENNIL